MFALPEKYIKTENIAVKKFLSSDLTVAEKKRLKESLVSVCLTAQIMGEEIPSIVNEDYNCSVIMFLDVKIKNLKDATYVCGIIQSLIKAHCIIKCYDTNDKLYSFSRKRLNKQDKNEIVITESILTRKQSIILPSGSKDLMERYLSYDKIKNRNNKLNFYTEIMIKSYIITCQNLFNGILDLLDNGDWYNSDNALIMLSHLKELERLKMELKVANTPIEKAQINREFKKVKGNINNG